MIRSFLTTNIWLKIVSFIMAIALWFFVILSGRSEIIMDISAVYANLPAELELIEHPKKIKVSIAGQESSLKDLKQYEVTAFIDLANATAGTFSIPVTEKNIKLPRQFSVTGVIPETITLKIRENPGAYR